jgi:2-polyprenyl-3-methyl-5-hydroxy-6-metoxy-1,4-benzoquinol methylase
MRFAKKATPNKIKNALPYQIARHLFKPHDQAYDRNYYAEADVFAVDSAHAMAKTITERFQPKTVIDVGCGTGALLEAFRGLRHRRRDMRKRALHILYIQNAIINVGRRQP